MSRFKSLTIGQRAVVAGKKRKCSHSSKHAIVKGDVCLEIRDGIGWRGYCGQCGLAMIAASQKELAEVQSGLAALPVESGS